MAATAFSPAAIPSLSKSVHHAYDTHGSSSIHPCICGLHLSLLSAVYMFCSHWYPLLQKQKEQQPLLHIVPLHPQPITLLSLQPSMDIHHTWYWQYSSSSRISTATIILHSIAVSFAYYLTTIAAFILHWTTNNLSIPLAVSIITIKPSGT